ncbi:hypothetical protein ES703_81663 [subsurface metagenome]
MPKFEVYVTLFVPYTRSFIINPVVPDIHYAEAEAKKICRKASQIDALSLIPLAYNKYEVKHEKRLIGRVFIKEID